MTPKFKLDRTEPLYLNPDFVSNGHWLISRPHLELAPQRLRKIVHSLPLGTYNYGVMSRGPGECVDLSRLVPSLAGYVEAKQDPVAVELKGVNIHAYIYETPDSLIKVGVQPKYIPILEMGKIHVKSAKEPFVMLNSEKQVVAVLMPVRLS